MMAQPSAENEFALMMHARIVSLEQLVDGLRRDLDTRVPLAPATAFSIYSRVRSWYFSVKVWADAWPQDKDGEDRAIRAVLEEAGRLGGKSAVKGQKFEDAGCMVYGGRSIHEVALPALWQNLMHAANGRVWQYYLQGGVARCECNAESFELCDPMKLAADLALSTQLGDSDVNLQHPRALAALHDLYDA
ncbi:hypothetical protein WJX74_003211 [Apatococcus lobatus]|uniref:Uncharacterized protein n=1 Tax=Apatococcus lobatus TaxID=904363 RepID=A0AAW1R0D0_9CHLO